MINENDRVFECLCGKAYTSKGRLEQHKRRNENNEACLPIPSNQLINVSRCPKCFELFNYWQEAVRHANKTKHYGYYGKEGSD